MTQDVPTVDRAAAVRGALCRLVARNGFHGASMAAVAEEAGVATGTAYVHYASKEELVYASFLEVKRAMGEAGAARLDPAAAPRERFGQLWSGVHDHLAADPDRARFLVQVESSPYAATAHERAREVVDDALLAVAGDDLLERLAPLPLPVLYDLAIGPVVRLVAGDVKLDRGARSTLAEACWRAATRRG